MKKRMYMIAIAALSVVFIVSAFLVGSYLLESKQQEAQFDGLSQVVQGAQSTDSTEATGEDFVRETAPELYGESGMLLCYEPIYEMNHHTVGWIKIEGTQLDYPVMQTPNDPNFYLDRDFYGDKSKHGCIYAWEEADVNAPSDNITLFGHNMADGSMFATLNAYTDKATWENNSLIMFDTLNEYHTYQIFAVFRTTATMGKGFSYHKFVNADTEKEFDDFIATCKKLSIYDTGITPKYGDKLICLSTCEYTQENGRLVVVAVRIT